MSPLTPSGQGESHRVFGCIRISRPPANSIQSAGALIASPRRVCSKARQRMKITTFNTEYWHIPEQELIDHVHYQDMDIVFFQEHLEKDRTAGAGVPV